MNHGKRLKTLLIAMIVAGMISISGCANIHLGPSYDKPLKEQVVKSGSSSTKILVIHLDGMISDRPKKRLLGEAPSMLDAMMMQLDKAEQDKQIKAVLLKINSRGGGVTASDILYHELLAFKKRSGKKLLVQMMDVAASGGVYVAMAADHIQAHPSTITGSVGVIAITADLSGTMEKIGAGVNVYKTGASKDMGSPFRAASDSDRRHFQSLVDEMAGRFYEILQTNRDLSPSQLADLKSARIYTDQAALKAGLVDSLGYISDAIDKACELAEAKDCQVVSYRYKQNDNATIYSPNMQFDGNGQPIQLLDLPLLESAQLKSGIYYLYLP